MGLNTDHFKINKFYGDTDPSFKLVYPQIARMFTTSDEILRRRRDPRDIPTDHNTTSGELRRCLWGMLVTDPKDDLARIQRQKESRVGHTCEWLLRREEFSFWAATSDAQLLRLVGSAGIGKTMMSLFLVDQLKEKVKRTPNALFAYFFFDNKDEDRNTPLVMLRSVIRQLLLQKQELFPHIQAEFNEKNEGSLQEFRFPLESSRKHAARCWRCLRPDRCPR